MVDRLKIDSDKHDKELAPITNLLHAVNHLLDLGEIEVCLGLLTAAETSILSIIDSETSSSPMPDTDGIVWADRLKIDRDKHDKHDKELSSISKLVWAGVSVLAFGEIEVCLGFLADAKNSILSIIDSEANSSPMADMDGVAKDKIMELLGDEDVPGILDMFSGYTPDESTILVLDE